MGFGPSQWHMPENLALTLLTTVPLPAAIILCGAGLIVLIGLGAWSSRQGKNSFA